MGYSPPGSSVHRILQARILEWVTMPFFRGFSWPSYWIRVSCGKNHWYLPTSPLAKLFSMDFPWISSFKPHHSSLTWILFLLNETMWASQVVPVVKNPPTNSGDTRDLGSIPGLGRSPEGGHGNPLQYSCLENPHGQRSLAGYSSWGCRESDMNEAT